MGNWRTVHIIGTCHADDVPRLQAALTPAPDYSNFHCLLGGVGLFGLPNWADEQIDATGNLAERGYDPEDVQRQLVKLGAIAPSLTVIVHCGGDYEDTTCVASVVLENGSAEVKPPLIADVGAISDDQILDNFAAQMQRARRL